MKIAMDELVRTFERDGAVILPGFFLASELRGVNGQLAQYQSQPATSRTSEFQQKTYTDTQTWHPVEDGVACFIELMNHKGLREVTRALVGNYIRHDSGNPPAADVSGPWYSLDFTFTVEPGVSKLPRAPITAKAEGERVKLEILERK